MYSINILYDIKKYLFLMLIMYLKATEWKQTITEIEKQLASLKVSISSTDGLFTDLFKKGKELELEIDNIKKKNMVYIFCMINCF